MTLRITLASTEEAALVHRIMIEAFAEYLGVLDPPSGAHAETVEDVARAMAKGGAVLAWQGEEAVGSARFRLAPDHVYVGRVSVLPGHRRAGIASAMMRFIEDLARRLGRPEVRLGVRVALPSNLALYERLGYQTLRTEAHARGPDRVAWLAKRLEG